MLGKPKKPAPRLMDVTAKTWLTPHMIRVTLKGDFVSALQTGIEGANCKIFLPEDGQSRESFTAQFDTGPRPTVRTYTVRHIRPETAEMDIDFVDHGDAGPASAWARRANIGDFCGFAGPGPAKVTDFYADYYIVAADMSAIPVAAATLEAMPRDAEGIAIFEITSEADRQDIDAPEGISQHWLIHPDPHVASTQAVDAIRDLPGLTGRVQTCIAGESSVIKALRVELLRTRGLRKEDVYISGYWKIGLVEDEHQVMKRAEAAA